MTTRHEQLLQSIGANDAFRVGALLSEDPDLVTARDDQGRTPILLALYLRHEDLARLIRERAPVIDIFEAAALGESAIVEELLRESPDLANAAAPDGFGPLGLAVYFGRPETAKALLEAGADPNAPARNEFKVRPLHSALANRDPSMSLDLTRMLLEWKADPNVSQAGGWTPLHAAAAHGRAELAKLLLDHGASPKAKSEDDRTPLAMARAKGHTEVERILAGEDV